MKPELRDFEESDAEELKALWLEFVQDVEGSDLNIVPSQENAERWLKFVRSIISSHKGNLTVALVDGILAGYIFYSWDASPLETKMKKGQIYDLYVKPLYRNVGIGTLLLEHALKELREHTVQMVQLIVMSKNTAAIRLYEKFGFREVLKVMRWCESFFK